MRLPGAYKQRPASLAINPTRVNPTRYAIEGRAHVSAACNTALLRQSL